LLLDREWAAAKNGGKGAEMAGAKSVSDGVGMYRLTDNGLAVDFIEKSTRYSRMMR